jgi:hypothetical protein
MYMRIDAENHAWLARQSAESGLPMARVADAIFTAARLAGWQVTSSAARVVQPDVPPGAAPRDPGSHRRPLGTAGVPPHAS